jgi:hypothetical protein
VMWWQKIRFTNEALQAVLVVRLLVSENFLLSMLHLFSKGSIFGQNVDWSDDSDLNSGPLPYWIPWFYWLSKFGRNCLCG